MPANAVALNKRRPIVALNQNMSEPNDTTSRPLISFLAGVPIAILGGLMGLGGAEFRLPVLLGPLRYPAKQAVPMNLAISFVTLAASLATRWGTFSLTELHEYRTAVLSMIAGAVVAAYVGASLVGRISEQSLRRLIAVMLAAIGSLLVAEGLIVHTLPSLAPTDGLACIAVGIVAGLAIGVVSSLLGVAGGELIIPTLVFVFGAAIKTAGTGSLVIGLPTVAMGIFRYARRGAYREWAPFRETIVPMGAGSIIGAVIGGLLVGAVPAEFLKVTLGLILLRSATKLTKHK